VLTILESVSHGVTFSQIAMLALSGFTIASLLLCFLLDEAANHELLASHCWDFRKILDKKFLSEFLPQAQYDKIKITWGEAQYDHVAGLCGSVYSLAEQKIKSNAMGLQYNNFEVTTVISNWRT